MNTVYASTYLYLSQFLSSVSYSFLSIGLLPPWLNLFLRTLFGDPWTWTMVMGLIMEVEGTYSNSINSMTIPFDSFVISNVLLSCHTLKICLVLGKPTFS